MKRCFIIINFMSFLKKLQYFESLACKVMLLSTVMIIAMNILFG